MSFSQDRQLNFSGRLRGVIRASSFNMILVSLSVLVILSIVEIGLRTVRYHGHWERAQFVLDSDFGDTHRASWLLRLGKRFKGEIHERITINGEEIHQKGRERDANPGPRKHEHVSALLLAQPVSEQTQAKESLDSYARKTARGSA